MTRGLRQSVEALIELLARRFAEKPVVATAVVTGVQADPVTGQAVAATVRIGAGAEETIALSYGAVVHVGDVWEIAGSRDPVGRIYTLQRRLFSLAASEGANLARPMPTLTLFAHYGRQASPTGVGTAYGPDKADHLIRYYSIRRGQYDLVAASAFKVRYRVRPVGSDNWTEGPILYSSPSLSLSEGHPTTTLAAPLAAGDTTLTVVASPRFPVCGLDERIRLLVGNELVEGRYLVSGGLGVVSNLVRGLEPVAGDPTTLATSHAAGEQVTLCTVDVVLEDLAPGTPFEAQIAAVDVYDVTGPWSSTVTFTSWRQTAPPPPPAAVLVEAVPGGFEVRWGRPPIPDVKGYIVRRWSSPDWANAAKLIQPQTGEEEIIENNWVFWPSTRGVPQSAVDDGTSWQYGHFGVKTVRTSGVESASATWGSDTAPPPSPDPANVSVQSLTASVLVTIAAQDPARLDRGWREFVLFSAATVTGDDERHEMRTSGLSFVLPTDPANGRYYQVVSADWNNNVGPRVHAATHWKRDGVVLPAPSAVTAEAVQGGVRVRWTPVTGGSAGATTVRGYRVARHTASLEPNVGGTVLPDEVEGTEVVFPGTLGSGTWLGVAAVSHAGGLGAARWAEDGSWPAAPTSSAWSVASIPEGFRVAVSAQNESARQHPAFREYWIAYSWPGHDPLYLLWAPFSDGAFEVILPGTSPRQPLYVQLLTRLWNGRMTAPQTPFSAFGKLVYVDPPPGSPPNGTFERAFATGVPHFWTIAPLNGASGSASWLATGGCAGPRRAAWFPPSGTTPTAIGMVLLSDVALPFSRARPLQVAFHYAGSLDYAGPPLAPAFIRLDFSADARGLSYLSTTYHSISISVSDVMAETWKELVTTVPVFAVPAGAQSVTLGVHVEVAAGQSIPAGFALFLDDLRLTQ